MRTFFAASLALLAAFPAYADQTEGIILAFDRKAHLLVLIDKTVWELPAELSVPDTLGAGDRVLLTYQTAGEDGITSIDALDLLAEALPEGTDGGS